MKVSYEAASNTPLHVFEMEGNERSTLYGYQFRFGRTAATINLDGILIDSGLTIDIVPVRNERLQIVLRRPRQPVREPSDLPTRADIVHQLLDAGLTPAEASEMASIEVEIGMARDD